MEYYEDLLKSKTRDNNLNKMIKLGKVVIFAMLILTN